MGRFEDVRANVRRAYESMKAARAEETADPPPIERIALPERPRRTPAEESAEASAPLPPPSITSRDDSEIPHGLRIAAAWSWRVIIIGVGALAVLWLVGRLSSVLIPLSIALLLSALLAPMVGTLNRLVRLPRSLATGLVLVTGIAAVAGTLTLVITQFVTGFPALSDKASTGVQQIQNWLQHGPLHLSSTQLDSAFNTATKWVNDHREALTSSALSTAAATLEFLASLFLVLFSTFFFLRDGKRIWRFVTGILPGAAREQVATAGEAAWRTLVAYVRATVLVAFIDAVGIGLSVLFLRVHFALPLGALVFIAAFVPIVGATVSGSVAVLVALVDRGPVIALGVLIAVIAVQQLEGHVLQPLIMGRAVSIHPLAVIVAIATGVVLDGIIGALVAVPIVAVLNTGIRHLVGLRRTNPDDIAGNGRPSP